MSPKPARHRFTAVVSRADREAWKTARLKRAPRVSWWLGVSREDWLAKVAEADKRMNPRAGIGPDLVQHHERKKNAKKERNHG